MTHVDDAYSLMCLLTTSMQCESFFCDELLTKVGVSSRSIWDVDTKFEPTFFVYFSRLSYILFWNVCIPLIFVISLMRLMFWSTRLFT